MKHIENQIKAIKKVINNWEQKSWERKRNDSELDEFITRQLGAIGLDAVDIDSSDVLEVSGELVA